MREFLNCFVENKGVVCFESLIMSGLSLLRLNGWCRWLGPLPSVTARKSPLWFHDDIPTIKKRSCEGAGCQVSSRL